MISYMSMLCQNDTSNHYGKCGYHVMSYHAEQMYSRDFQFVENWSQWKI